MKIALPLPIGPTVSLTRASDTCEIAVDMPEATKSSNLPADAAASDQSDLVFQEHVVFPPRAPDVAF